MTPPPVGTRVRVVRDSKYSKVPWEGRVHSHESKRVIDVVWLTGPHRGSHQTILAERTEAIRRETRQVLREVLTRPAAPPPPPFTPEPLFPTRRSRTVLTLSMLTAGAVGFLTGDWSWYG